MQDYFVHPAAIVEPEAKIGKGTRIWAFAHILPGAVIGSDCNICDHTFIENDVIVGDRVTIKSGVQLWDSITIEDDVFVGPNATFTNDPYPHSKHYLQRYSRTIVRQGASIGANSTILPGITIGVNAMVGAGAVVTRNVPPNALVVGNPARIKRYVASQKIKSRINIDSKTDDFQFPGVKLVSLNAVNDMRGNLIVGEYPDHLPFKPKRIFMIYDVPNKEIRGEHAHKEQGQFLVCLKGSVNIAVDNGIERAEFVLDSMNRGLYISPMVWATQYKYTDDAVLMVLASDVYDTSDYIRDYNEFLALVKLNGPNNSIS